MVAELTDEELYAKCSDRLIRFASTIVGPHHAEDVMIDGVLAAMQSSSWGRVESRVNYLYRCVLNAGRMHLRSAGRRRRREEQVWRASRGSSVDESIAITLPNSEVRAAVAGLSARQRAVIFLTYWEDLDERATADRLGISVGSVRRHLHRARQNVGRQLDADV